MHECPNPEAIPMTRVSANGTAPQNEGFNFTLHQRKAC